MGLGILDLDLPVSHFGLPFFEPCPHVDSAKSPSQHAKRRHLFWWAPALTPTAVQRRVLEGETNPVGVPTHFSMLDRGQSKANLPRNTTPSIFLEEKLSARFQPARRGSRATPRPFWGLNQNLPLKKHNFSTFRVTWAICL